MNKKPIGKNTLRVILLTGLSGSGKSIALHALEDSGYYCVDNLPPELFRELIHLQQTRATDRIAIAVDVRSAQSLQSIARDFENLRAQNINAQLFFLDADTQTLMRRFSETRRKHPLCDISSPERLDISEAIEEERQRLQTLREIPNIHFIDTSLLRSAQLQTRIKSLLLAPANTMTVLIESFAFKRGAPRDADFIFDVRMLPNPHYEEELRPLTGCDAPVAQYLRGQLAVEKMQNDIAQFLQDWLPALERDHRSYVTIAIGCTGGQHRSVYLVETLFAQLQSRWSCLKRHRELEKHQQTTPKK